MNNKPPKVMIYIAVLIALLVGALVWYGHFLVAAIGAIVCAASLFGANGALTRHHSRVQEEIDLAVVENATASSKLFAAVNVPCMIYHPDGRIIWRNSAMQKLYDGANVKRLPDACQPKPQAHAGLMEFGGGAYQVMSLPVERKNVKRQLLFQYWLDKTEAEHYRRLYEEQMPYVALIYVDNYEELSADLQFQRSSVLTEVERLVSGVTEQIEGIYRRYESGRFLLVFEAKRLETLEKDRFSILERAHKIETGTEQQVSLSIAVGAAARIKDADSDARHAMELALGRGGDQAVVKVGTNYVFYGGRRQLGSGQSRVRARLFAKALRQLMENSTEVFIMGHRQPDMDCIGAALGVYRCAQQVGIRAHILLDQVNPTIQQAVDEIRTNPSYAGLLITPEAAKVAMRPSSVLVVVDTQRPTSTMAPELLKHNGKLVLIDHHRRSADYIDNATLNYLEARASSTCEMVTETMQYFHEGIRPAAFECSTMLAGIALDTKNFAFNVGARTFEAAAYLRQHGADISAVKLMFQDDRETYANRVDTVKAATILCPGVAVSSCRDNMENASLIAAQAADALIGIRGIEASFVLARRDNGVNISGRSLGRVNAQVILEKLGGGGHLTMAGAQVENISIEDCLERLKGIILNYMREIEEPEKQRK
ncbi:DHH family phosphoesterase [Christensenellaceae bacterium OttesenSCG-928-M15]|nr:DHH family phosphoesterase [Christensenellaceae bacterium OttesenSCG-928-M15]